MVQILVVKSYDSHALNQRYLIDNEVYNKYKFWQIVIVTLLKYKVQNICQDKRKNQLLCIV